MEIDGKFCAALKIAHQQKKSGAIFIGFGDFLECILWKCRHLCDGSCTVRFYFFLVDCCAFLLCYIQFHFFLSFCRSCLYFGSFCVRMGEEIDINVVSLNKRMCVLFWLCIKLQNIIRNTNIHTLNSLK